MSDALTQSACRGHVDKGLSRFRVRATEGAWLTLSSDSIGADHRATFVTDPVAVALPDAIRRASLHAGISWLFLFGLAAPAIIAAEGIAYFLFEPLNAAVVIFASVSIAVALRAAWKLRRDGRRAAFFVDLPISVLVGAVVSFVTYEILVAQLSPLDRYQVSTLQLFYWFACIPGGFTIVAQVLLLACATRWGLGGSGLRWPLVLGLVGAVGLPIVASTWLYSSVDTPLWPLGLILVLVSATSDIIIFYRPKYSAGGGIASP